MEVMMEPGNLSFCSIISRLALHPLAFKEVPYVQGHLPPNALMPTELVAEGATSNNFAVVCVYVGPGKAEGCVCAPVSHHRRQFASTFYCSCTEWAKLQISLLSDRH